MIACILWKAGEERKEKVMKLKKLGGVLLTAVMTISCVACGNSDGGNSSGGGQDSVPAEQSGEESGADEESGSSGGESESAGDLITLTTVRSLDSNVKFDESNPDRKSLDENIWNRTYQEKYGVKLEYLWTPNSEQYDSKWNAALATGDIPDFANVSATIYKQLVEADLVMDMTDVYNEYASDAYKAAVEKEDNLSYDYMTFDGKLLGLPYTGAGAENITLMMIRKDWLDQVNMEVPKTLDELKAVVKAFQDNKLGGEGTVGIAAHKYLNSGVYSLGGIMESYGAFYNTWIEKDGRLVYSSVTDEMRDALLELQGMYRDGLLRTDFASLESTDAAEDVAAGKCGVTFGTYWAPLNGIPESYASDENAEWIVCETPTVDGSPVRSYSTVEPVGYMFVSKDCEHPEKVVEMMNMFYEILDSDAETYASYMTDGTGFEVFKYAVANNFPAWKNLDITRALAEPLEKRDPSTLTAEQEANYNMIVDYLDNGNTATAGYYLVFGKGGTYDHIGTMYDEGRIVVSEYKSLPTDTMTEKWKDLNDNLSAAMQKVVMGEDISVFDTAVETWKSTGGDQITQEVNDWYSRK